MEWVETTGPTVEAALDAALDELGCRRGRSRVRGHPGGQVGPLRSHRRQSRPDPGPGQADLTGEAGRPQPRARATLEPPQRRQGQWIRRSRFREGRRQAEGRVAAPPRLRRCTAGDGRRAFGRTGPAVESASESASNNGDGGSPARSGSRRRRRSRGRGGSGSGQRPQQEDNDVSTPTTEDVPIGEQADVADEFMRGLVAAFGLPARGVGDDRGGRRAGRRRG